MAEEDPVTAFMAGRSAQMAYILLKSRVLIPALRAINFPAAVLLL